ncbi:hypothetical protein EV144_1011450 [Flavobacterium sp. 270]|nr:hypothetical protein EV144_1011450 [Flavobacterium sp. 270]
MKKHYSCILILFFFVFSANKVYTQPYYTLPQWNTPGHIL